MAFRLPPLPWRLLRRIAATAVVVALAVTWSRWWPPVSARIDATLAVFRQQAEKSGLPAGHGLGHDHSHGGGHDHDHDDEHGAHEEENSLALSPQALRNLGLDAETIRPVTKQSYRRTITVPAIVAIRPGRTQIVVATPMTGILTHVHATTGQTVEPDDVLFHVRLTHEDLVSSQTEYLKTVGELSIERREIARLEDASKTGTVSARTLLERQYARDRLEVLLRAQHEALRLHGLSERQVSDIAEQQRLLKELRLAAPYPDTHDEDEELRLSSEAVRTVAGVRGIDDPLRAEALGEPRRLDEAKRPLVVERLAVRKGQSVPAGELLCVLSDYGSLYVEGRAFEQDAPAIETAAVRGWTVEAVFDDPAGARRVPGLKIAYVAHTVDEESRTLSFYVDLPNEIVRDEKRPDGTRYVDWRHRPGRRLELRVPVEEWPDQFVVPAEAVANEGAESYVFQQNGTRFERVPVHVRHKDAQWAVIADDGSIFPGDVLAMRSAHRLQLALRSRSAPADAHAGHSH